MIGGIVKVGTSWTFRRIFLPFLRKVESDFTSWCITLAVSIKYENWEISDLICSKTLIKLFS
jgi:hypothetical protein